MAVYAFVSTHDHDNPFIRKQKGQESECPHQSSPDTSISMTVHGKKLQTRIKKRSFSENVFSVDLLCVNCFENVTCERTTVFGKNIHHNLETDNCSHVNVFQVRTM